MLIEHLPPTRSSMDSSGRESHSILWTRSGRGPKMSIQCPSPPWGQGNDKSPLDCRLPYEVPTEIKLMTDKRSVELYLKLLESGSEKKRDIRLVVVGKKGAGKTSLIKRLFGEDNTDVTSTNGIEIHKIKCKAMSDDGIWNKLDGNYEETEIHARLLKEYEEKLQDKGTIEEPVASHCH
ncbi:unnamed protein product [Mytilus edulis]|uniref:Uncharacterized protein n=1 Tax=Mytilus edulis TaxID=6550 RepID=A0A8S3QTN7_MYTED|nr:unnamed protein product [Mytilus edulis]